MISRCGLVACDSSTPPRFFVIRPETTRTFRLITKRKKQVHPQALSYLLHEEKIQILGDQNYSYLWSDLLNTKCLLQCVPLVLPTSKQSVKKNYPHRMETKRQCAIRAFDTFHGQSLQVLLDNKQAGILRESFEHQVFNCDGSMYQCTFFIAKLLGSQPSWLPLSEITKQKSLDPHLVELLSKATLLTDPYMRTKKRTKSMEFLS